MAQIEVKDLAIGYENKTVVSGLTFSVEKGMYLVIVGENGAGKSTLMKTMLGLQKPLSGEIKIGEGKKKRELGYLPQQNASQKDFPASVWEVVMSGFVARSGLRPSYTKGEKALAAENIGKVGLTGMEKRSFRELSGGQQQRVLLARALCATQELLFLDEPVAGLDPEATVEMYTDVAERNKEGATIVMISHDVEGVMPYATHVLHIGKRMFFGTKEDYLQWKGGKEE